MTTLTHNNMTNESPMAKMKLIGRAKNYDWYFADDSFEKPGIYYWNGKENINVIERLLSLENALGKAESQLQFWLEHARDGEGFVNMPSSGRDTLSTLKEIRAFLKEKV